MDTKLEIILAAKDATGQAFGFVQGKLHTLKNQIFSVQGAIGSLVGAYGMKQLASAFMDAGLSAERSAKMMAAAVGGIQKAGEAQNFLKETSERLGLTFETQVQGFAKLAAASKGTALEGEKTKEIYLGIAEAGTALQLSSDQVSGALTAVEQMISKGKVSAEELRGQLGERLPGAFQIAAEAIGVTTSELDDMLKKGEVISEEFLPRFAAALRERFGEAAKDGADSMQAAMNRATNAWYEFRSAVMEEGVLDFLKGGMRAVAEEIDNLKKTGDLAEWARDIAETAMQAFEIIVKGAAYVGDAFRGWEIIWNGLKGVFGYFVEGIGQNIKFIEQGINAVLSLWYGAQKKIEEGRLWAAEKFGIGNVEALKASIGDLDKALADMADPSKGLGQKIVQYGVELQQESVKVLNEVLSEDSYIDQANLAIAKIGKGMQDVQLKAKKQAIADAAEIDQNLMAGLEKVKKAAPFKFTEEITKQLKTELKDIERALDAVNEENENAWLSYALNAEDAQAKTAELNKELKNFKDLATEGMQSADDALYELQQEVEKGIAESWGSITKTQDKELKKQNEQAQKIYDTMTESIQTQLSEAFQGMGGEWKDMWTGMKSWALKMIADIAAAAMTKQIIMPLIFGTQGAGGTAAATPANAGMLSVFENFFGGSQPASTATPLSQQPSAGQDTGFAGSVKEFGGYVEDYGSDVIEYGKKGYDFLFGGGSAAGASSFGGAGATGVAQYGVAADAGISGMQSLGTASSSVGPTAASAPAAGGFGGAGALSGTAAVSYVGAAVTAYDIWKSSSEISQSVGASAAQGAMKGAMAGVSVGFSVGGPYGAAIGGIIGLVAGGLMGAGLGGHKQRPKLELGAGEEVQLGRPHVTTPFGLLGIDQADQVDTDAYKGTMEGIKKLTQGMAGMMTDAMEDTITDAMKNWSSDKIRGEMDPDDIDQLFVDYFRAIGTAWNTEFGTWIADFDGSLEELMTGIAAHLDVMHEINSILDPTGTKIEDINMKFDDMKTTLEETGGSSQELAKLERARAIQLGEIRQQSNAAAQADQQRAAAEYERQMQAQRQEEARMLQLIESFQAFQMQIGGMDASTVQLELIARKFGTTAEEVIANWDTMEQTFATMSFDDLMAGTEAAGMELGEFIQSLLSFASAADVAAKESERIAAVYGAAMAQLGGATPEQIQMDMLAKPFGTDAATILGDWDNIKTGLLEGSLDDWKSWAGAAGLTLDEFTASVLSFDNAAKNADAAMKAWLSGMQQTLNSFMSPEAQKEKWAAEAGGRWGEIYEKYGSGIGYDKFAKAVLDLARSGDISAESLLAAAGGSQELADTLANDIGFALQLSDEEAQKLADSLKDTGSNASSAADSLNDVNNELQRMADAWGNVIENIKRDIEQMMFTETNPQNVLERMALVRGEITGMGAIDTVEEAERARELYATLLQLGKEAYQRPTEEYRNVFDEVLTGLQEINVTAQDEQIRLLALIEENTRNTSVGVAVSGEAATAGAVFTVATLTDLFTNFTRDRTPVMPAPVTPPPGPSGSNSSGSANTNNINWLLDIFDLRGTIFDTPEGFTSTSYLDDFLEQHIHYQHGGIQSTPTFASIAENGPEAIIPLQNGYVPVKLQGGNFGGDTVVHITVQVTGDTDPEEARRKARQGVIEALQTPEARAILKRNARWAT